MIVRRISILIIILWFIAAIAYWLNYDGKMQILLGEFVFNLLVVGVILGAAWALGDRLKRLVGHNEGGLEGFLVAIGLGLGADILLLFIFGLMGLIYTTVILAMIAAPLLVSVGIIRKFFDSKPWQRDFCMVKFSGIEWIAVISFFAVGGMVLLSALQPEVFFDALYYHIGFPSLYLIRHRIEIYPNAVHSAMPSNIDLLYTMPLAFAGPGSVRLFHILFYVGSGLWVYLLGRRYFGREAGLTGCMLWACIPGAGWMAGLGAVDMGVTFFELGAVTLLLKWVFNGESRRDFVISAILLGISAGSKYSALMVGVICALGVIAGSWRRRGDAGIRGAIVAVALFGGISIAVASPWYIRSWVVMGDPFYPALSSIGTEGARVRDNLKKDSVALYPLSETFLKLPVDLWEHNRKFGAGSLLGLGAIAFLPALLWGFWRRGAAAWIGIGVLALYLMWSRSILIVRYFYPGLALSAVLAGGLLAGIGASKIARVPVWVFLALILLYDLKATTSFYESSPIGAIHFATNSMSVEESLEKYVPHTAAAGFVRENLPKDAKLLLVGETQGYYFKRDYMPVSAYDRHPLERWVKEVRGPLDLRALIKGKGFTHLLLCRHEWVVLKKSYGHLALDEPGSNLFEGMIGGLVAVYKDRFYEVYAL